MRVVALLFLAACGGGTSSPSPAPDAGDTRVCCDAFACYPCDAGPSVCPDAGVWACTILDAGPPDTYDPYCQDMVGDATVCVGTGQSPPDPLQPPLQCAEGCLK